MDNKDLEILQGNEQTSLAWARFERNVMSHKSIMISVSGGADSDIMIDLMLRLGNASDFVDVNNYRFVFFDTGIEYQATKKHLDYLERKYNIKIEREKASVPVPIGCKRYGVPFLGKDIADKINVLQNHNFDFANDGNKELLELLEKYCPKHFEIPKNKDGKEKKNFYTVKHPNGKKVYYTTPYSVILWWCNAKENFNINETYALKEFLIENPPKFKISAGCCKGAKKNPSHIWERANKIDLKCMGLRKSEGGIRATKKLTCFNHGEDYDLYRPIWYFSDSDKEYYKKAFGLKYSDCYEVYGLKRTGCFGCPFDSDFENTIEKIEEHEPKLYKACMSLFSESYEYMRAYRKFKEERKQLKKQPKGQFSLFDVIKE